MPPEPYLHKPNRLSELGRVMKESRESHGTHMGKSPGTILRLLGGQSASAGPRNISQAYGQWAEGRFPMLGPLWKVAKRRLVLRKRQECRRCPAGAFSAKLMQPWAMPRWERFRMKSPCCIGCHQLCLFPVRIATKG